MWLTINPSLGKPIYLQIIDQIRHAMGSGYLNPGDKLPSVRDMATELTVSPNTVVRAYRELESEGLIATRQGSGTFIARKMQSHTPEHQYRILKPLIGQLVTRSRLLGLSLQELVEMVQKWHRTECEDDRNSSED